MSNDKRVKNYVIYGASGHAKVIYDIIVKNGGAVLAFVDDRPNMLNSTVYGRPVWGGSDQLRRIEDKNSFSVIIGIGDNHVRHKIAHFLKNEGFTIGTVIHPSAQLGTNVQIGEGTVVMAGSVINSDSKIGVHCIINTSSSVDHDCIIGNYAHLSPGSHLGGNVQIGDLSWVGLGASVIHRINIAENVVVGAGSVVIRDVEPHVVVVGNPASFLRPNK